MTSANDKILDAMQTRALDLQRLAAGQARDVNKFLTELQGDIVAQLARIDPTGIGSISRRATRLEKLLAQVKGTITASYRSEGKRLANELREIADMEARFAVSAINNGAGVQLITSELTRGQLVAITGDLLVQGAPVSDWLSRQAGDTLTRFTDNMRLGIAQGETNGQLIRRIRGGKQNGAVVKGFMDITRHHADSLVRSATQAVSQASRQAVYDANDDIVKAEQWVSTIDLRTTEECGARDGLTYTVGAHEPIDHTLPWGGGPGNLHWGALVEGTLIRTKAGLVPIEFVKVGDLVLTHLGRWKPVTDTKCKPLKGGVVRVINTKSGGVLRATDDHPIFSGDWKFAGALKVGDDLRSDAYCMKEIIRACDLVAAKPEYGPALTDEGGVAAKRALKLVAPDIGFECASNIWAGEVENRAIKMILGDPLAINRDQSFRHHMLSVSHVLSEVGRDSLGHLVSMIVSEGDTTKARAHGVSEAIGALCCKSLGNSFRNLCRVVRGHASRRFGIFGVGFFGLSKSPMFSAGRVNDFSAIVIKSGLVSFVADSQAVPFGVARKNAVAQSFLSLNASQGKPVCDMPPVYDVCKGGVQFGHDVVLSLGLHTYSGNVYDLEVKTDASYIANGIAVSNCRSTSTPVLKSFRELGLDIDEVPETTRASLDGQIPQDTSFEGWLSRRSVADQDANLGVGRAKLWRDGDISFRDLMDANGRPLTLMELQARMVAPVTRVKPTFTFDTIAAPKSAAASNRMMVDRGISRRSEIKGEPASVRAVPMQALEMKERFGTPEVDFTGNATKVIRDLRMPPGVGGAIVTATRKNGDSFTVLHLPDDFGRRNELMYEIAKNTQVKHLAARTQGLEEIGDLGPDLAARVKSMPDSEYRHSIPVGFDGVDQSRATITHEYGHLFHDNVAKVEIDNFLTEVRPTETGWGYLVSSYGNTLPIEYVAECFTIYNRLPDSEHYRIHPKLLEIFREKDAAI